MMSDKQATPAVRKQSFSIHEASSPTHSGDSKQSAKCLNLCAALGEVQDGESELRRASYSTNCSTLSGPSWASEASQSEVASSHGGLSPRGDVDSPHKSHHNAKNSAKPARPGLIPLGDLAPKTWADMSADLESPDSSPKRSRRRRQRNAAGQSENADKSAADDESPASAARGARTRKQQEDHTYAASESPIRSNVRQEMRCENEGAMAASSSPVRRGAHRGIMGTTVVATGGASMAWPVFQEGRAGYSHRMGTMPAHMGTAPPATSRFGGIMSTSPSSSGGYIPPSPSAGLVLVTAPPTRMPPPQMQPQQRQQCVGAASMGGRADVNQMLKSVLGSDNLPTGEDLDAMLRAAQPEVYSD